MAKKENKDRHKPGNLERLIQRQLGDDFRKTPPKTKAEYKPSEFQRIMFDEGMRGYHNEFQKIGQQFFRQEYDGEWNIKPYGQPSEPGDIKKTELSPTEQWAEEWANKNKEKQNGKATRSDDGLGAAER